MTAGGHFGGKEDKEKKSKVAESPAYEELRRVGIPQHLIHAMLLRDEMA